MPPTGDKNGVEYDDDAAAQIGNWKVWQLLTPHSAKFAGDAARSRLCAIISAEASIMAPFLGILSAADHGELVRDLTDDDIVDLWSLEEIETVVLPTTIWAAQNKWKTSTRASTFLDGFRSILRRPLSTAFRNWRPHTRKSPHYGELLKAWAYQLLKQALEN